MNNTPLPVHPSWIEPLAPVTENIHVMGDFLRNEIAQGRGYLPAGSDILRAFQYPFDDVKVLIVGQDPYPTPGHAMGLSFSTQPGVRPLPRSLANIFKELSTDLSIPAPTDGDLTAWSRQGVALFNRVLSVQPGNAGSHRKKRMGNNHRNRHPSTSTTQHTTRRNPVGQRRPNNPSIPRHHPRHHLTTPITTISLPRILRLSPI